MKYGMRRKTARNYASGGPGLRQRTGPVTAKQLKTLISGSYSGKGSVKNREQKMETKNNKPKGKQGIAFDLVKKFPGISSVEMKSIAGFPCAAILSHLYTQGFLIRVGKKANYHYFVNPQPGKNEVLHCSRVEAKGAGWNSFIENCKLYDRLHSNFVRMSV